MRRDKYATYNGACGTCKIDFLMKVEIIGKGKVGCQLYNSFSKSPDVECRLINSRTLEGHDEKADIVLLTVSDNAIPEMAEHLRRFNGILAHVSGSTPIERLGRSTRAGVLYPFQSFSKGVEVDMQDVPVLVEGTDEESLASLRQLAVSISRHIITADGEKRKKLHLAGVFGCNFMNEMMAIAFQILRKAELPEELLYPLIRLTVEKGLESGPENVRTGPASRGDTVTISKQEAQLKDDAELLEIYRSVTERILNECALK